MREYQLPQRLAIARTKLGLTRRELGVRAGLQNADSTIFLFETTSCVPHLWALCRLADVLNTSTDYLLGRSDYMLDPGRVKKR